jgi:hypothetical protein
MQDQQVPLDWHHHALMEQLEFLWSHLRWPLDGSSGGHQWAAAARSRSACSGKGPAGPPWSSAPSARASSTLVSSLPDPGWSGSLLSGSRSMSKQLTVATAPSGPFSRAGYEIEQHRLDFV